MAPVWSRVISKFAAPPVHRGLHPSSALPPSSAGAPAECLSRQLISKYFELLSSHIHPETFHLIYAGILSPAHARTPVKAPRYARYHTWIQDRTRSCTYRPIQPSTSTICLRDLYTRNHKRGTYLSRLVDFTVRRGCTTKQLVGSRYTQSDYQELNPTTATLVVPVQYDCLFSPILYYTVLHTASHL